MSAFWFSGLLLAALNAVTGVLNHFTTALYAQSRESHHPLCHPLRAQDSAGRRSINWLYLLHHGIVICQGRPDFAGGSPDSGEHRRTNAQKFDSLASGNSPALWLNSVGRLVPDLVHDADLKAALKRLWEGRIVRLSKAVKGRYHGLNYSGNESADEAFFFFAEFNVTITDDGRRYWDGIKMKSVPGIGA